MILLIINATRRFKLKEKKKEKRNEILIRSFGFFKKKSTIYLLSIPYLSY